MKNNVKIMMDRQAGGTILGFVIGLVVGLAIAVVVALMITKTSSPFTNKLGMTKPADAPVIQLTDPNKPLYGNAYKEPPARPADNPATAPDVADYKEEPQSDSYDLPESAKLNSMADSRVDTKAETKVENKSTDTKLLKSADNATVKNGADEKATYYLQVGAFHDSSDAENARAKLALIGVESTVSGKKSEGDSLFRVRIGPFDKLETLNRMRSKLSENSIDVAVIKTPK